MRLVQWLRSRVFRTQKARRIGRTFRRRSTILEALEDRAMMAITWQVQSDYFGTQDTVSQARSLRGLALSADDQHVYGGFIAGTTSAAIREVGSGVNAAMIGNEPVPFGTNPPYTTGLEARVTTFNQPKGTATDDRGNVYATLTTSSNASNQSWGIYNTSLSSQLSTKSSSNAVASQLSGIAAAKLGGQYFAYVGWKNGQIERWDVTNAANPVLDAGWGVAGKITLKTINANAYLNGLEIADNGDIFVAGGLLGTTSFGDALIRIPAAAAAAGNVTAGTTSSTPVGGGANGLGGPAAMDVALYGGNAYVTEYLQTNSTIGVFNQSTLASAGIITPPNLAGPSGQTATYNSGTDSGFSGIDISGDGKIYVAEQVYKQYASTTNPALAFTPPGGTPILGTRVLLDRIIVSSQLDQAGPVTSSVVATPNPVDFNYGGNITLTANVNDTTTGGSTIASAEYSVDGGPWVAMAASDGNFNQVSENVTATFTLISAGIATNGPHTLAVRGKDAAGKTGAPTTTTLTVNQAPSITSADHTTFQVGLFGTFTVTTGAHYPAAETISESGPLPTGVTFVDNGNGTATLSGTPDAGQGGVYVFSITASNGYSTDAMQAFTLRVNEAPTITSQDHTTFTVGSAGSFTVTTGHSYPPGETISEFGALPSGVSFVDNNDGTASLAGTPDAGTGGVYAFTITASNGINPDATQNFTLKVNESPAINSANTTTFFVDMAGSFTVTTAPHYPFPATISKTGALPSGVSFVDNGNGTATLSGTPASGTAGTYVLMITANNGVAPNGTQNFTLIVKDNVGPVTTGVMVSPSSVATTYAGNITLTANVSDSGSGGSTITSAEYSINGGTWVPMNAADMNFNSVSENVTATFTLASAGITSAGMYTISVRGKDSAGNTGPAASTTLTVTAAANTAVLVQDPCYPTKMAIVVTGTSGNDTITVKPKGSSQIEVKINNVSKLVIAKTALTGHIIVYAGGGNDTVSVDDSIKAPTLLLGEGGNDKLTAGGGPAVLVGGEGDDNLDGKKARDILIGGNGKDNLRGGDERDLLIAGWTDYDTSVTDLCMRMDAWLNTTPDYSGFNGHVHDDGVKDDLDGQAAADVYFANATGPGTAKDTVHKTGTEPVINLGPPAVTAASTPAKTTTLSSLTSSSSKKK
jgi:hypothetical protein